MVRKGKAEDCRGIYELICDMEEKELPWDDFSQMYGGNAGRQPPCLFGMGRRNAGERRTPSSHGKTVTPCRPCGGNHGICRG